jgi:hypothetical protein
MCPVSATAVRRDVGTSSAVATFGVAAGAGKQHRHQCDGGSSDILLGGEAIANPEQSIKPQA